MLHLNSPAAADNEKEEEEEVDVAVVVNDESDESSRRFTKTIAHVFCESCACVCVRVCVCVCGQIHPIRPLIRTDEFRIQNHNFSIISIIHYHVRVRIQQALAC